MIYKNSTALVKIVYWYGGLKLVSQCANLILNSDIQLFYIFTAVKYSFFKICIIFSQYFPVFHYFVYNKNENVRMTICASHIDSLIVYEHFGRSGGTRSISPVLVNVYTNGILYTYECYKSLLYSVYVLYQL